MFLKILIASYKKEVIRPNYSSMSGKPMASVAFQICKQSLIIND